MFVDYLKKLLWNALSFTGIGGKYFIAVNSSVFLQHSMSLMSCMMWIYKLCTYSTMLVCQMPT